MNGYTNKVAIGAMGVRDLISTKLKKQKGHNLPTSTLKYTLNAWSASYPDCFSLVKDAMRYTYMQSPSFGSYEYISAMK